MNKERLLQLAEHLEKGQLGHKYFSFSVWNSDDWEDGADTKCGTTGCAIGECPFIWPDDWKFDTDGEPVLTGKIGVHDSVLDWFNLSVPEARHLFIPDAQSEILYGGRNLTGDATKYEVAANIRAFIEKKENEGRS